MLLLGGLTIGPCVVFGILYVLYALYAYIFGVRIFPYF